VVMVGVHSVLHGQCDKNKSNAEQYQRQFIDSESKYENMRIIKNYCRGEVRTILFFQKMNYLKSKLEASEKGTRKAHC
jgi:hypothetical protein